MKKYDKLTIVTLGGKMKIILLSFFLLLNINLMSETLYYKDITNNNKNAEYFSLNYPEECKKILEISEDSSYEFKDDNDINSIIKECNLFMKGNNFKKIIKAGSDAIIDKGIKVKEDITEGFKKGTGAITDSMARETNLILDDTVKLKDGVVGGAGKILNTAIDTGSKITKGVGSFFKGMFSSQQ